MPEQLRHIRVEAEIETNKQTLIMPPTICDSPGQAREALDEFLAELDVS